MASGLPLSTSRSFGGALVPTSSSVVNTRPSQVAPKPVLDLPALQSASHVLQEQFAKDAQAIPDLAETLTTREHDISGAVGMRSNQPPCG